MRNVEIAFKFEIGDVLIQKVVLDAMLMEKRVLTNNRFPEGIRVVMRCSEECVAGTQLSYICEPWQGGMQKYAEGSLVKINEAYDAVFEIYKEKLKEKAAKTVGDQDH